MGSGFDGSKLLVYAEFGFNDREVCYAFYEDA